MSPYSRELTTNWRALAAAALGMGSGLSLNAYMGSVFAPHVLREFGWPPSQYALIGLGGAFLFIIIPFVGRLTDMFGVRKVAAIGVVGYPLTMLLFSQATSDFRYFFAVFCLQNFLGAMTTAAVYSRIVAQKFDKARGLAISLAVTGPAVIGAAAGPLLTHFILSYGWRAGYQLAAAIFLVMGVIALIIMPASVVNRSESPAQAAKRDYGTILRSTSFWLIFGAMFLANVSHAMTASQLSLMLIDSHAPVKTAASLASLYAAGVIVGRLLCGGALDRFPAHIVAGIAHILPAAGMFMLGSDFDQRIVLAVGLALVGVAIGAEGDIAGYLVVKLFGIEVYGTVFGLVSAGIGLATVSGSALLSWSLSATGSFALFLNANGGAILASAVLFFMLGRPLRRGPASKEEADGSLAAEEFVIA